MTNVVYLDKCASIRRRSANGNRSADLPLDQQQPPVEIPVEVIPVLSALVGVEVLLLAALLALPDPLVLRVVLVPLGLLGLLGLQAVVLG
jgi:hypothetical protein